MSDERKQRLQEKLAALAERLTDKERREEVVHIREAFDSAGVSFEWTPDASAVFNSTIDTLKVNAWGWFDESTEFNIISGSHSSSDDSLRLFRQLADEHNLKEAARVHFLWVYGPVSVFTFNLGDVLNTDILKVLFETDSEFWIAEETGRWCFIVHHEGTAHLALRVN